MRIGGITVNQYNTTRADRPVKLWKARWRAYPASGAVIQTSRSGFATKGMADEFVRALTKAEFGTDGWTLSATGHPEHNVAASRPVVVDGPSVLSVFRAYAVGDFAGKKPNQRANITTVLARVVALTLVDANDRNDLLAALAGAHEKLDARIAAHAAAIALREAVFVADPDADRPGGPHETALAWLAERSMAVAELDRLDNPTMARIRARLTDGLAYRSGRTYMSRVVAAFNWAVAHRMIPSNPCANVAAVKRDRQIELVDPTRVPDHAELDRILAGFDAQGLTDEGTFILVCAYAALRGGEGYALDVRHFRRDGDRYQVIVSGQYLRAPSRHVADRTKRAPTKESNGVVEVIVPLPVHLTARIEGLLNRRRAQAGPDAAVFVGPRGARLTAKTFIESHWSGVVDRLFDSEHRLHGITPHSLRAFGMTMWLRSGIDPKRCQVWGRWKSVAVMLDTYARCLPSDEQAALDLIDSGDYAGKPSPQTTHTPGDNLAEVVSLTARLDAATRKVG